MASAVGRKPAELALVEHEGNVHLGMVVEGPHGAYDQ